jgi:23S rRNA pseudouridine1911/1915/1917 synthase
LDRFLAAAWPDLSRTQLQRLLASGDITVNGGAARASRPVRAGDRIEARLPAASPSPLMPEPMDLRVVYEDADLLVIDKPAGLVVHPAPGHSTGTLVNGLLARCPDLQGIGGVERPGIVHRLDKDTSGLIVVAKNQRSHDALSRQIRERQVMKKYLALVHGCPRPAEGIVDAPIGRDPAHRQRMDVVPGGREAVSEYRILQSLGRWALVEVRIHTGRTHQIRVHMAHIGHPVAGDAVYGSAGQRKSAFTHLAGLDRQFLHASVLGFRLPSSGEYREFTSELPDDLARALHRANSIDE